MSQQFCLKWNNHMNNMMEVFKSLLSTESMVDVTLACDGLSLKAHKMVLSACSPFFQSLFLENPCKHPIVILKDMKYTELKAIIEFMYHGEVNVAQDQLSALMKTAETLRVKGLAEVTNEKNSQSNNSSQDEPSHRSVPRSDTPPPSNKRRRGRTRKRSLSDSNRSDDDSNEPKIKQPMSPEIEELSGGDHTMDTSSQFSNMQSQVPMQSSHSSNTFHKTSAVISQPQIEEPTSPDGSEFGVEPAKLLEQTLTTEELNARRRASNIEMQRRPPRSSTDHSTIVPTSLSSDTSNQQPDSPPDIKPELLELDPPMSPVAGPSHSNDNAMMMYMDQSNTSHPGPSGYQESTALVPQDSQNQDYNTKSIQIENYMSLLPSQICQAKESSATNYHSTQSPHERKEDTSNLEAVAECMKPRKRNTNHFKLPDSSSEDDENQSPFRSSHKKSYLPHTFSSSLTFSSPPPHTTSLVKSDSSASIISLNTTTEVLDKKLGTVLSNQKNMLHLIDALLKSTKHVEHKLETFITNQNPQVQPISSLENDKEISLISSLPLGVDDFEKFDKKIAQDKDIKKILTHLLITVGGRDVKSHVCKLMRRLMVDEVGERYSLTGKSAGVCLPKMPFEQTEAYKLILEVCFRNFNDLKINIVRETISDWLMQSKFRKSKREKRSESRLKESFSAVTE